MTKTHKTRKTRKTHTRKNTKNLYFLKGGSDGPEGEYSGPLQGPVSAYKSIMGKSSGFFSGIGKSISDFGTSIFLKYNPYGMILTYGVQIKDNIVDNFKKNSGAITQNLATIVGPFKAAFQMPTPSMPTPSMPTPPMPQITGGARRNRKP